jgi:hypothetical protein
MSTGVGRYRAETGDRRVAGLVPASGMIGPAQENDPAPIAQAKKLVADGAGEELLRLTEPVVPLVHQRGDLPGGRTTSSAIPMGMSCVRGKVVSGRADFGLWIERLSSFYEQKTGMRLYPGTLNVELPSPYSLPRDVIRLEANEYGGRVSVSIVPCRIFNRKAFLLRTDQNEQGTGHHPRNVVEIATDTRLRDAYQLRDGDVVEIEFR